MKGMGHMFKIMIVDDELIILNGLRTMLENCSEITFPVDIVTASNVPTAIELLTHYQPDLLLADITMPVMDGFDLIRHIRALSLPMDIVILTSHASFDYAREAISLQITDYLLKPVNREALVQSVLSSRQRRMEKDLSEERKALLSLRAMMLYDVPFFDLLLDNSVIRKLFPYSYYTVIVLKPGENLDFPDADALRPVFSSFCETVYSFLFADRREYIYLCNHKQFSINAQGLKRCLSETLYSSDFLLGISISSSSCETLHQLYTNGIQRIFYQEAFPHDTSMAASSLFTYQDCVEIFLNPSEAGMKDRLKEYIAKMSSLSPSECGEICPEQIWNSFFHNICFYLDSLSITLPQPEPEFPPSLRTADADQMTDALYHRMEEIKRAIRAQEEASGKNEVIQHLIRYIKANYQRDLSLNDLAEEVHMNPNYLSGLFKKVTSCSYLQYLHQERLAVVKKLLSETDLNMEQIAQQAGYNSSVQLNRLFKKYEHMLPSDYRIFAKKSSHTLSAT